MQRFKHKVRTVEANACIICGKSSAQWLHAASQVHLKANY